MAQVKESYSSFHTSPHTAIHAASFSNAGNKAEETFEYRSSFNSSVPSLTHINQTHFYPFVGMFKCLRSGSAIALNQLYLKYNMQKRTLKNRLEDADLPSTDFTYPAKLNRKLFGKPPRDRNQVYPLEKEK